MVGTVEKQSGSVVDRPRMIASGETFCGGLPIFFAIGGRFRRMRTFAARVTLQPNLILPFNVMQLHANLHPRAAGAYESLQVLHETNTVLRILDDPFNFQNYVTA
jgi:hypothetical protein